MSAYDTDLDKNPANFQPLTPLTFLERSARVFPAHTAVIHGSIRRSYRDFYARARRLASALARAGIGKNDTVAVICANTPAMLEAHYGVPMCGAVLNTLNTRLDAPIIAFSLDHGAAKAFIVDREFSKLAKEALALATVKPLVIDYDDPEYDGPGERIGTIEYEDFIAGGDPDFAWQRPGDEWDAIALNYTSGTTGTPRASSITTAAPICSPSATSSPAAWPSTRSICGRCRCSTATAGASPGPSRRSPAPMSACAGSGPRPCTTPSSTMASPICAARPSS